MRLLFRNSREGTPGNIVRLPLDPRFREDDSSLRVEILIKIAPRGIVDLDESELPSPVPMFDLFLARDRLVDIRICFEPDGMKTLYCVVKRDPFEFL
jgi:hypothetical protein